MDLPSPRRLALGGVLCSVVLALLAAFNWTPAIPQVPAWLTIHAPWVIDVALVLNTIGRGVVLVPLTVVIVAVLYGRGHRAWAVYVGACGLAGLALVEALKAALDRPRPDYALIAEASGSFPSGHAAAGVYCWVVFGIAAWHLLPRIGRPLGATAIVIGVALGPSRLVLGVHYWPDVLGGWAAGGAATLAVAALVIGVRTHRGVRGGAAQPGGAGE